VFTNGNQFIQLENQQALTYLQERHGILAQTTMTPFKREFTTVMSMPVTAAQPTDMFILGSNPLNQMSRRGVNSSLPPF
jgi:hypothetical protein